MIVGVRALDAWRGSEQCVARARARGAGEKGPGGQRHKKGESAAGWLACGAGASARADRAARVLAGLVTRSRAVEATVGPRGERGCRPKWPAGFGCVQASYGLWAEPGFGSTLGLGGFGLDRTGSGLVSRSGSRI